MGNSKIYKILTIVLHSIIVIGAGHGIGIMIMLDFMVIPLIIENNFSLDVDYNSSLGLVSLISLIGKVILLSSYIIRKASIKKILEIIGLVLLWTSFYLLTSDKSDESIVSEISFWTGIPFFIGSVIFFFSIISKKIETNYH
mgnify:CR=1 FL=1